ncbi:MAG: 5'/3'-nucleotidase SurE [Spirochaetaceae bacterium]|jgi:5'-nucleotidase|nr:5'/3'-nucleotidase SurE [Spirochaetaceae bacterium]
MNILLTNDDGIAGDGFSQFTEALRSREGFRVYVVAPDGNRSGVSSAITVLSARIELNPVAKDTWTCPGTPSDCVRLGIAGAVPAKIDLLVSGINKGANIGRDIVYSGTAAAARQGAFCGIPSVAYSLDGFVPPLYWEEAIDYAVSHLGEFAAMWERDIFLNVNMPNIPGGARGYKITYPSRWVHGDFISFAREPDGTVACAIKGRPADAEDAPGTDRRALVDGYVSVSPIFLHPVVRKDLCPAAPPFAAVGPSPEGA